MFALVRKIAKENFSNRDITSSTIETILFIPNERADGSFNEKLDEKVYCPKTNKLFLLSI
jgi:hypothetical protein